jgi:putative YhbY family RNA-binding protein
LPRVWSKEAIPDREGTTFQKKQLRRLQSRSRRTDATIWIGKQGATEDMLKHVASQLKARELVKLKVHKSALTETETSKIAEKAAASTGSTLVEVMGHTFTLYKRRELAKPKEKHRAMPAN